MTKWIINRINNIPVDSKKLTRFVLFRLSLLSFILVQVLYFHLGNETALYPPKYFLFIYSLIALSFIVTACCMVVGKFFQQNPLVAAIQIGYDIVFTSGLIYYFGVEGSIYTFLYLISIILASVLFYQTGAVLAATLTSVLFGIVCYLDLFLDVKGMFYQVFVNNMAFFLTALLCGRLAEQLKETGQRLASNSKLLRELKDFNKTIVNSISSGLITVDLDDTIISYNMATEKITGVHYHEALGQDLEKIFPEFIAIIENEKTREIKQIRSISPHTLHYKNRAGKKLHLDFIVSILKEPATEEHKGYVMIIRDQTEIYQMEEQLKRQERMAAVGQLAAGIAHEIRNPLASMSGSIEMLQGANELKEEDQKLMSIVLRETDRLNSLISDFLNFVRPREKEIQEFLLLPLVNETVSAVQLQKQMNPKTTFHVKIESTLTCRADKNQLKQVFWNLVLNAVQAMPEGGKIFIEATQDEKELKIIVSDTGIGMDEKIRKRVFEPFFTNKANGTGLGLATAYKLIEDHGGRIEVESEQGKGTTFTIIFIQQ